MILENSKSRYYRPPTFIVLIGVRYFLALVFLSAGAFRFLRPDAAEVEFVRLGLPVELSLLMATFEIIAGACLLFSLFLRTTYFALASLLTFALFWAFFRDFSGLVSSAGELFVFDLSPTDWLLHAIFLSFIAYLAVNKRKELREERAKKGENE